MAKIHGVIGYVYEQTQTLPGIWEDNVITKPYYGELLRSSMSFRTTSQINDDLTISNEVSILADPYAHANFPAMRYFLFQGTKWKITNVDIRYPRLILTIGGIYND